MVWTRARRRQWQLKSKITPFPSRTFQIQKGPIQILTRTPAAQIQASIDSKEAPQSACSWGHRILCCERRFQQSSICAACRWMVTIFGMWLGVG
mmetsp:Transcript_51366/g.112575  ORF Transcript_51366/g.112575 Transcript_51366/m.112575 type:complete len:94 (-) Transcript_51366:98-379(-)